MAGRYVLASLPQLLPVAPSARRPPGGARRADGRGRHAGPHAESTAWTGRSAPCLSSGTTVENTRSLPVPTPGEGGEERGLPKGNPPSLRRETHRTFPPLLAIRTGGPAPCRSPGTMINSNGRKLVLRNPATGVPHRTPAAHPHGTHKILSPKLATWTGGPAPGRSPWSKVNSNGQISLAWSVPTMHPEPAATPTQVRHRHEEDRTRRTLG